MTGNTSSWKEQVNDFAIFALVFFDYTVYRDTCMQRCMNKATNKNSIFDIHCTCVSVLLFCYLSGYIANEQIQY